MTRDKDDKPRRVTLTVKHEIITPPKVTYEVQHETITFPKAALTTETEQQRGQAKWREQLARFRARKAKGGAS